MPVISNTDIVKCPRLLPDREAPYRLAGVYELWADGCRVEFVLDWGDSYLVFQPDADTDSFCAQFFDTKFDPRPEHRSVGSAEPWAQYVDKPCSKTWGVVNPQGYCDSIMICFGGIFHPNIMLYVIGSSITVFSRWRTTMVEKEG